jgi:hypothetical protein
MIMGYYTDFITFRIDPHLSIELRKTLEVVLDSFKGSEISVFQTQGNLVADDRFYVDFISENSLQHLEESSSFKICLLDKNQGLFSFGQNIEESQVNAILDDGLDAGQIEKLINHELQLVVRNKEDILYRTGNKNAKKFESKARLATSKLIDGSSGLTSEALLKYAQELVDLEKELIHTDDISKFEKILKQFVKNNFEKVKFQLFTPLSISKTLPTSQLLVLPKFKGDFLAIEFSWDDSDYFKLIKKIFFYYTLVNYFSSKQEIIDPFFDDSLWDKVLDGIPFPVALLSYSGEIYQHNSLFSKLNVTPINCLNYNLREKILVNDIPYNVFRNEIHHLDERKVLFVFFTESFFLKGDGNLTPSGQELGIISSSIAHELNNPIAGVQAALSLLMLTEDLNEEARQTLTEMKNGATRCKQLIETFLGFSRATPKNVTTIDLKLSPIEICYQQAQNLLRFRTVESGIRFSFLFIRHSEFRASVNLSLLTMTFYLILGELMTQYSHQLLVAEKNQIEKVIKGEIIESSQEIQIQLNELNISSLSLSKLIQNLLTIENFVLQVSDYSLRFIYSPPRDAE